MIVNIDGTPYDETPKECLNSVEAIIKYLQSEAHNIEHLIIAIREKTGIEYINHTPMHADTYAAMSLNACLHFNNLSGTDEPEILDDDEEDSPA